MGGVDCKAKRGFLLFFPFKPAIVSYALPVSIARDQLTQVCARKRFLYVLEAVQNLANWRLKLWSFCARSPWQVYVLVSLLPGCSPALAADCSRIVHLMFI